MGRALHDAWWRLATQHHPGSFLETLAATVLHAGSLGYGMAVRLRNAAYDRGIAQARPMAVPVVSIGNLTVGGTGKTACVELIATRLLAQGKHPVILTRGYGGGRRGVYWLTASGGQVRVEPEPSVDGLADEPQVLARRLPGVPVVVGARRDQTGALACARLAPDVLLLDDGFQHRRVRRQCDIVLVHARMPLGGWPLLPRGPMREPLTSLRRADLIIITKADEALEQLAALQERLRTFNPHAEILTAVHEPAALLDGRADTPLDLARLQGARLGLVSSIGDPDGFEATVRRLEGTVLWHRTFPDHYRYTPEDWSAVLAEARRARPSAIVTTEKDWVRLAPHVRGASTAEEIPVWILGVRMALMSGDEILNARLAALFPR